MTIVTPRRDWSRAAGAIRGATLPLDGGTQQFTQHHIVGNIRERKFSEIWTDPHAPLLEGLRNRKEKIRGRCATCKWLPCCNGNFRAHA